MYVVLELLAAGAVGVSVVSVLAWPDCPSLHVCQGIPPCSCSPVPGALSLLCCWNRDCVALLSLQRMDTAECHCVLGFGTLGSRLGWLLCSGCRRAEMVSHLPLYRIPKKGKIIFAAPQNPPIFAQVV